MRVNEFSDIEKLDKTKAYKVVLGEKKAPGLLTFQESRHNHFKSWFLLQDITEGNYANELHGFVYSWILKDDNDIREFMLTIEVKTKCCTL